MPPDQHHEHVIIGAGPAGIQLALEFEALGRDYVVLEARQGAGSFFGRFPRHRRLLSINKVRTGCSDPEVNLRFDWNSLLTGREDLRFGGWSTDYFPHADDLVAYLETVVERLDVRVRFGTRVTRIARPDDFALTDASGGRHTARRVTVATGLSHPNIPPIPGVELAEPYGDMPVDAAGFRDARVLVIGKGNSAFETANHLTEEAALIHLVSPHSIEMAWRTHYPGHLRAVNNDFLDTYQLKSQNAILDADVLELERAGGQIAVSVRYAHAAGETETLHYDRVLLCAGFRFDPSIFDADCRPALTADGRLPALTSAWESTTVPDLHFAGVLMASRDAKRTNSAFIHGFRYNVRALSRMLELRDGREPWPSEPVDLDPEPLARSLLERLNRTSALWQQFGFLADVVALECEGGPRRYPEVPVDFAHDAGFPPGARRLLVTLEFGPHGHDPFRVERHPRPELASRSTFLHPVLRLYDGAELRAEHHVLENLLGEWRDEDLHVRPLVAFLQSAVVPMARRGAHVAG